MCTYDTGQYTSFETGPIMVNGALIGTTEHDIFSIDPTNCHENWRTHEDYKPASLLRSIAVPPTWTGCYFAALRMGGYWLTTSKPASEFGKR